MARDYFQDILPPSAGGSNDDGEVPVRIENPEESAPRGIRSIQPPSRPRPPLRVPPLSPRQGLDSDDSLSLPRPRRFSRWIIWIAAVCGLLVVAALALLSFRSTTITVIPKSRQIALSNSISFIAGPESRPISSSPLTYAVHSFDIEDSEVIPAQGVRHVENKASGSIVVYNEYSASSVKLIKNTRFETPEGLIFRVLADVVIPGKSGSSPGEIKVTVVADAPGEKYNVGPVSRFTLPGLKSGDMYSKVYAKSTTPMVGGIVGDEPATAPGALTAAISAVRTRLTSKAQEAAFAQAVTAGKVAFPGLAQISYQSLPNTTEAGSAVRIHEKAHIEMPIFSADVFAAVVAQSATEVVQPGVVQLVTGENFQARLATTSSIAYGVDPITFTLMGDAQLIWNVDSSALSAALAGRENSAFETIVGGFAGIQEAHARIEPPWKKSFPTAATGIRIEIEAPKMAE